MTLRADIVAFDVAEYCDRHCPMFSEVETAFEFASGTFSDPVYASEILNSFGLILITEIFWHN